MKSLLCYQNKWQKYLNFDSDFYGSFAVELRGN